MNEIFSKNRVETFSDGIFAIIITLLVLEIKVPHISDCCKSGDLLNALVDLLPKFVSWIMSFFTVAVIWVNHHKLFKQFKELDSGIFWWNALLLLWTSFIPFPTAVLGDFPENFVSVVLYGLVMALMAGSFTGMRYYVLQKPTLLNPEVNIRLFRIESKGSFLFGPMLYVFAIFLGYITPVISFSIFLFIPFYFIFFESRNHEIT